MLNPLNIFGLTAVSALFLLVNMANPQNGFSQGPVLLSPIPPSGQNDSGISSPPPSLYLPKNNDNGIVTLPAIPMITAPAATIDPSIINQSLDNFKYPKATIVNDDSQYLAQESLDDVQAITNWYKNRINDLNMNSRILIDNSTDSPSSLLLVSDSFRDIQVKVFKAGSDKTVSIEIMVTKLKDGQT
jgi:hypothetical protein